MIVSLTMGILFYFANCQEDLAVDAAVIPQGQSILITTNNICIYSRFMQYITLDWNKSFPFKWIRIKLLNTEHESVVDSSNKESDISAINEMIPFLSLSATENEDGICEVSRLRQELNLNSEVILLTWLTLIPIFFFTAGVGRTGTFIALHNVIKESEKTGRADFFNTVVKLRQDRMQMVQTAKQYEFLHRAALAANVCIGTTFPVNNLSSRLKPLDEQKFASQSKIDFEFKAICDACETNNHKTKESPVNENDKNVYENTESDSTSFKNRFSVIIPSDTYRPCLTCYNSEVGDYINAVILSFIEFLEVLSICNNQL
ncbi:Tyrosine-protein phosphatase 69D [Bulinus truncatus]|nr:Tyrosine-protein phosphatase 69D [Bulinus truncatus]